MHPTGFVVSVVHRMHPTRLVVSVVHRMHPTRLVVSVVHEMHPTWLVVPVVHEMHPGLNVLAYLLPKSCMTTMPVKYTAARLRTGVMYRVIITALIWTTGFCYPVTSWANPEAAILEQQILNDRQQQELIREQQGYQQRLHNPMPTNQKCVKGSGRELRF